MRVEQGEEDESRAGRVRALSKWKDQRSSGRGWQLMAAVAGLLVVGCQVAILQQQFAMQTMVQQRHPCAEHGTGVRTLAVAIEAGAWVGNEGDRHVATTDIVKFELLVPCIAVAGIESHAGGAGYFNVVDGRAFLGMDAKGLHVPGRAIRDTSGTPCGALAYAVTVTDAVAHVEQQRAVQHCALRFSAIALN